LELAPFGLEHIYAHMPDCHHPVVHLGDVYGSDGRHRVIYYTLGGVPPNISIEAMLPKSLKVDTRSWNLLALDCHGLLINR
jgi:hypothetical protein